MLVFTISLDLLAVQIIKYSLYTFHFFTPFRGLRPIPISVLPARGLGHVSIPALDHLTQHDSEKCVSLLWILIRLKIMSCLVGMCCRALWLSSMSNISHLVCDSIMWLNWQVGVSFSKCYQRAEGSPNATSATSVCGDQSLEVDGLLSSLILLSLGWPAENHTAAQET